MTDTPKFIDEDAQAAELASLKERADLMGLQYHPKIGLEALRERVNARLTASDVQVTKANKHTKIRKEASKLVRVIITPLSPGKKESEGEYFRVANSVVPTIGRFVPFNIETHVENMILNHIKNRKYVTVRTTKKDGKEVSERQMRNEFQVELLAPLTKEELKQLAIDQSKRQSVA